MNIVDLYNSFGGIKEPTWLDGRSYSDAFVICIGAGPWRFNRRKLIQEQALQKLNNRDLLDIREIELKDFYPLKWQNNFLKNIIDYLLSNAPRYDDLLFNTYCLNYKLFTSPAGVIHWKNSFYKACGCPKGAKVLSLFLRDSIKFDYCFPIDRHVRRFLQQYNLPITEDKMVNLCLENGINPRLFAIGVAEKMGIENPNWSIIK